jgi:hypothetical protein
MKQACGGHGYLQLSGLTRHHINYGFGIVTAEGDNTVLFQQTAAWLLQKLSKGELNTDEYLFDRGKLTLD